MFCMFDMFCICCVDCALIHSCIWLIRRLFVASLEIFKWTQRGMLVKLSLEKLWKIYVVMIEHCLVLHQSWYICTKYHFQRHV